MNTCSSPGHESHPLETDSSAVLSRPWAQGPRHPRAPCGQVLFSLLLASGLLDSSSAATYIVF